MLVADLLGHGLALLVSDDLALLLRHKVGDLTRHLLALLPRHILALGPRNLKTQKVRVKKRIGRNMRGGFPKLVKRCIKTQKCQKAMQDHFLNRENAA